MTNPQPAPPQGLRVVDMTTAWAGPYATRIFAFLGAEVIHVESANRMDLWRAGGHAVDPTRYPDLDPGERPWNRTVLFNSQNLDKKSLSLNVKAPGGLEALLRVIAASDMLVNNYTPGAIARMGLTPERLHDANSKLIVVDMPAFGSNGPMADRPALGPTMEFASGMAAFTGFSNGRPVTTGPAYLDPIGGLNGAAAALTALVALKKTGTGQKVEVSQVEGAMAFVGELILSCIASGQSPMPNGNRQPDAAPHDAYPCMGHQAWVAISVTTDAEWCRLARLMNLPAEDPRFATVKARIANIDALDVLISNWTRTHDKLEIAATLQNAGIAAAPVNHGADVARDPWLHGRGFFPEIKHQEAGTRRYQSLTFRFARARVGQFQGAPCLGADTEYVLKSIAGISPEDFSALEQSGAIETDPRQRRTAK